MSIHSKNKNITMQQVIKRNGTREAVSFDKILKRIKHLSDGLSPMLDTVLLCKEVIGGLYDGIPTSKLDELAAETAESLALSQTHPDYSTLAARITVSNLHKQTNNSFSETMEALYQHKSEALGSCSLLSAGYMALVREYADVWDDAINQDLDYQYTYMGIKTLMRSYLLRIDGHIVERPQYMIMRTAIAIHGSDTNKALETYRLMSQRYFTHATPTLFNAGTKKQQLSSCFLLTMQEDSIKGIYDTLSQCASISQAAGGIGLSISNIRAKGSYIRGTGGESNGIVPMLQVFNNTARYVDQGGGKRKGAFAVYLETWHADIFDFLDLKKNHGKEEMRARDLFYALWMPDLFMKRIAADGDWSLFCPDVCKGLNESYGQEFETLYEQYEQDGKALKVVKARKLYKKICETQIETGMPFMLYKDHANRKSNQKNLGVIKSSNLCTEILEHTSKDEIAVCNLASIAVSKFVKDGQFDFEELHQVTQVVARNLDNIIDINYYPVPESKNSNFRHRPMGVGVQGLADAFSMLRLPFDSEEAKLLNKQIFETIYHGALTASCELAKERGVYSSYWGSPVSKGVLQFDMWGVADKDLKYDWTDLRKAIAKHGIRNSLLLAPMPTATTSQILGNNECIEPYTANVYVRNTLAGSYVVANKHLIKDLMVLGLWNKATKDQILIDNGSVRNLPISDEMKSLYKTVWEIKQGDLIDMAADRGAFICQSQSMNIFMQNATVNKMMKLHYYAWQKGLKTGMYYLRTEAAASAIKFTVDKNNVAQNDYGQVCSIDNPDCEACGA